MFELTRTVDENTMNNVLYHVYLRFFERDRFFGHVERVERMHAIMNTDELRLIPTIESIVGEVEQHAGAPLETLSDAQLREYTRQFEAISRVAAGTQASTRSAAHAGEESRGRRRRWRMRDLQSQRWDNL